MLRENVPVVLVARGALAPPFLSWWRRRGNPLFVLEFSRWRWFQYGAVPLWLTPPAPKGEVVLFDRDVTTGQTLRLVRQWLASQGYSPVTVGHVDAERCRFGLRFLDAVWADGALLPPSALAGARGEYTFAVVGGSIPRLGGRRAPERVVPLRAEVPPGPGSEVIQEVPSWEQAMLWSYLYQKPLVLIAGCPAVRADYAFGECLADVEACLREEKGL